MYFRNLWTDTKASKGSSMVARLPNPAEEINQKVLLDHVKAISPHCAAVMFNFLPHYVLDSGNLVSVEEISNLSYEHGMLIIDSSNISRYGMSGELPEAKQFANAVVINADLKLARRQAGDDIGLIARCLCNQEDKDWVSIDENAVYSGLDIADVNGGRMVRKFIKTAHDAGMQYIDALTFGEVDESANLSWEDIERIRSYAQDKMILFSGEMSNGYRIRQAGGYFFGMELMVDVGTDLMFDDQKLLSLEEQTNKAHHYKDTINRRL